MDGVRKAAGLAQHSEHDREDAHQHDEALHEVVERGGVEAACDDVDRREHGHDDDAVDVRDAERLLKESREAVVDGRGVRDQEDEHDERGRDLERLGAVALLEVFRHGGGVEVLGHGAGAAAEDEPREQRADQRVAQTDPRGRDAVFPAELPRVADEHDGGEVAGAERERREPRADAAPAEDEVADVAGLFAAIDTDADHQQQV